jgi:hypothetical protein
MKELLPGDPSDCSRYFWDCPLGHQWAWKVSPKLHASTTTQKDMVLVFVLSARHSCQMAAAFTSSLATDVQSALIGSVSLTKLGLLA